MTIPEPAGDPPVLRLLQLPALAVGERLRIVANGERIDGRVARVTEDDVTLRVAGADRAIPVGGISEIGRLRTHARNGALAVGVPAALLLGFVAQALFGWEARHADDIALGWLIGGGVGLAIGGAIGGGIGAILSRSERVFLAPPGVLAVGMPTGDPNAVAPSRHFDVKAILAGWLSGWVFAWIASSLLGFLGRSARPADLAVALLFVARSVVIGGIAGAIATTVMLRMVRTRPRDHVLALVGLAGLVTLVRYPAYRFLFTSGNLVFMLAPYAAYAGLALFVLRRETGATPAA